MPDAAVPTDDLHVLADYCGVAVSYTGGDDQLVEVDDSTLRALLAAFSLDTSSPESIAAAVQECRRAAAIRVLPPVLAVTQGVGSEVVVRVPPKARARLEIDLEGGGTRALLLAPGAEDEIGTSELLVPREAELPADLPEGYHLLRAVVDRSTVTCHLVVAPAFLAFPDSVTKDRVWGFAAQLYSVPSRRSWGLGDLADLRELVSWSGSRHGADYLLINPINSAAPVPPLEPSPYLPVSRRFFDPQYLHVEDIEEFDALPVADRVRCAQLREAADGRADPALIDRDTAWVAKREALALVHRVFRSNDREAALRAYLDREGADLLHYATWCALAEQHGAVSSAWPDELQDPGSPAVQEFRESSASVDFHQWLQWQLDCQLAAVQAAALSSMQIGVMHDLPVGVHPDGADTWADRKLFATTVSVGAPPDAFNQLGQNWAQHPWRPDVLAQQGYAPFRKLIAGMLRHSGGLRVDHIIGLFRLWWIPQDRPATQGSYVRYDHEVLLGIAALEARRAGAVVIGEDLGTFEAAMQDSLRDRGIPGTSVLWFEMLGGAPLPPQRWREWCLASVTTHDLPPAACFVNGDHVRLRHRLGLLTGTLEDELAAEEKTLALWIDRLRRSGCVGDAPDLPEIVEGLYRYLTLTPCRLVNVALSDAVGDRHTQNLPGTTDEYPNWRHQIAGPDGAPMFLEDVLANPAVASLADAVADALGAVHDGPSMRGRFPEMTQSTTGMVTGSDAGVGSAAAGHDGDSPVFSGR